MSNLFYPKKSNYSCAWCSSNNTFILSNDKPKSPYIPYDDKPSFSKRIRNNYLDDDRPSLSKRIRDDFLDDDYLNIPVPFPKTRFHNPYNFVIRCNDCFKNSSVKLQKCRICNIDDIIITRSSHLNNGPFTSPFTDDLFNEYNIKNNYICKTCLIHPHTLSCEHHWIKLVNDLNLELAKVEKETSINLVCTKCNEKKTTIDRDLFDFYN